MKKPAAAHTAASRLAQGGKASKKLPKKVKVRKLCLKVRQAKKRPSLRKGARCKPPPPDLPDGPATHTMVLNPVEYLSNQLSTVDQSTISKHMVDGIVLSTDYSGSGQAERVMETIANKFRKTPGGQNAYVHHDRACDIEKHCQEYLKSTNPLMCIFTDIAARMPEAPKKTLADLLVKYNEEFVQRKGLKKKDVKLSTELGDKFIEDAAVILEVCDLDRDLLVECVQCGKQCPAYKRALP
jgi:hypothetical protein